MNYIVDRQIQTYMTDEDLMMALNSIESNMDNLSLMIAIVLFVQLLLVGIVLHDLYTER